MMKSTIVILQHQNPWIPVDFFILNICKFLHVSFYSYSRINTHELRIIHTQKSVICYFAGISIDFVTKSINDDNWIYHISGMNLKPTESRWKVAHIK